MLSYFLEEDLDFNSMFNQGSLFGKKIAHIVKMPIQGYGGSILMLHSCSCKRLIWLLKCKSFLAFYLHVSFRGCALLMSNNQLKITN